MNKPLARDLAAGTCLFVLDRLTKLWALADLRPRPSVLVARFFRLTYVENTGAAFGLGRGANGFFILLSIALTAGLLAWRRNLDPRDRWARWGVLLIASGAAGNLYDRLVYGYVVDFLDFIVWPVFNLADSLITVGAFMVARSAARGS